jgi:hypothetical protein
MGARRKATFYMDAEVHKALRIKAAEIDTSPSDLLNDLLAKDLQEYMEDLEDIADAKARRGELGKGLTIEQMKKKYKVNV